MLRLLACCLPLAAFAQAIPPPSSAPSPGQVLQEGLRRQEERSRELIKSLQPRADELTPDAPAQHDAEFPREADCFVVNEVSLTGPDAANFGWLLGAAMPYLRQCIGVRGLAFIAGRMDTRLRDAGFVTSRVSLPPQNLREGRLVVHVQAGRVADIAMADDHWGTWRNAFPLSRGDLLDIRDLEQGVENMKRLPSQRVSTRLEPGESPGTSVVHIERQPSTLGDRFRGGVTLDNSGSPALGRAQLAAHLAFDNPAGLSDIVTASLNTNAQQPTSTHRSQGLNLSYLVPWGYSLLTLSAGNTRFAQHVQGTTVRFLSSGRSATGEARLSRTVWRSASSKLGVYTGVSTRRAVSYLDDVEVIVQRRRTTNALAGLDFRHLFEQSTLDIDLSVRRGVPWHGAQDDFDSAALGGLTLRPKIVSYSGAWTSLLRVAGRPVEATLQVRGQHTRDTTLSVDQFSIGGRGTVRGFDGDAVLLAESGFVVRSELQTPVPLLEGVDLAASLALDYGRVRGLSDVLLAGNALAGMALGLRAQRGATRLDASLGIPLSHPDGFTSRKPSLFVSIARSF